MIKYHIKPYIKIKLSTIAYGVYAKGYDTLVNINENNIVYYGQYKTTNKLILNLMKFLTNKLFKFGAISQKIIRLIWKKNKLITYKEFANLLTGPVGFIKIKNF